MTSCTWSGRGVERQQAGERAGRSSIPSRGPRDSVVLATGEAGLRGAPFFVVSPIPNPTRRSMTGDCNGRDLHVWLEARSPRPSRPHLLGTAAPAAEPPDRSRPPIEVPTRLRPGTH